VDLPIGGRDGAAWWSRFEALELNPKFALPCTAHLALTVLVGFVLEDIDIIVDYSGAVGSTILAFIAPSFMYFRIRRKEAPAWLLATALLVLVFGLFLMTSGVLLSVLSDN
jgi:amino acid permease